MTPIDPADPAFAPLREQLLRLAQELAADAESLALLLEGMVADVERAAAEPLEIFPVAHHSPAAAIQLLRRLQTRPPRIIFLEGCEDLAPQLAKLEDCRLPVALQAFAAEVAGLPGVQLTSSPALSPPWGPALSPPLSLLLPLTEFSAEFQAIAYARATGTELLLVDRSSDHAFQWLGQCLAATPDPTPEPTRGGRGGAGEEAGLRGGSLGVQIGELKPTFGRFVEVLLATARVQHYAEWWDQYVEVPLQGADYATYRAVMFLLGSLVRRLGRRQSDLEEDALRERYMWTRIKARLAATGIDPRDALYICGAAHGASRVEEFGAADLTRIAPLPPVSGTAWSYGVLPSSYAAIEGQFALPPGTVSLAEATWKRQLRQQRLTAFRIETRKARARAAARSGAPLPSPEPVTGPSPEPVTEPSPSSPAAAGTCVGSPGALLGFLTTPPPPLPEDADELLRWSTEVTRQARKNGYLASTADSIAIYQTAVLLANLRNRRQPTPYDFRDAAVTCLEKDRVPAKRDIRQVCDLVLGGDRVGAIGYDSLPPLAQDVYDRLAVLPIRVDARTIQRALMDLRRNPEYRPCSELLWRLCYLVPDVARPIMGQLALGQTSEQESWDIAVGKHQGALVQLSYEGISVESVLERRLMQDACGPEASTVAALDAVERAILLLRSERLAAELGRRAAWLLTHSEGSEDARAVYGRTQRLVHYHRGTPAGVPDWLGDLVRTGYSHYCALLPLAFCDRGVKPEDLASMLAFVFTLEGLALSFGCERSELVVAVVQAQGAEDPVKQGLLWSAEVLLQRRTIAELRAYFGELLGQELRLPRLPDHLSGFLLALRFAPGMAPFAVELLSQAFGCLPPRILMPWLPRLFRTLRAHGDAALPVLIKEAAALLPPDLAGLATWIPAWEKPPAPPAQVAAETTPEVRAARALLRDHPHTADALAALVGVDAARSQAPERQEGGGGAALPPAVAAARGLLADHPETAAVLGRSIGDPEPV